MPRCSQCKKSSQRAALRSHAKNKVLRRQKANLQKKDGELVCSTCRRTARKKLMNS